MVVGLVAGGMTACSSRPSVSETGDSRSPVVSPASSPASSPAPSPQSSPSPAVPVASAPAVDPFQLALDRADSARSISQAALSPDDWTLAANRWQQAIALLKRVPAASPNKKQADSKLAEFQQSLNQAKQKVTQIGTKSATMDSGIVVDPEVSAGAPAPVEAGNRRVYRAAIKYRRNRIPVIDVVFNGSRRFEMMVDTGASSTMITQEMAQELGIEVVGNIPIGTAGGKSIVPVGFLRSISVGGATIKNVPVTIGPLELGLLGHDFFGDCDITIKRDVVEFQQCQ